MAANKWVLLNLKYKYENVNMQIHTIVPDNTIVETLYKIFWIDL